MAVYQFVLIFSAWFVSWGMGRVLVYALRVMAIPLHYAQLATLVALLGFLMVVGVPAGVLVGAWVLAAMGVLKPRLLLTRILPIAIAAFLGVIGLQESPGEWPTSLPDVVFYGFAAILFFVMTFLADDVQATRAQFNGVSALASIPLACVPFLFSTAHASFALDAGLLIASLVGGMHVVRGDPPSAAFLRMPVGLVMGYSIMQAVHYHAWPLALASTLIWLLGMLVYRKPLHG